MFDPFCIGHLDSGPKQVPCFRAPRRRVCNELAQHDGPETLKM